ncbi:MAG: glucosamine-6-phosphate deaminase [Cyanobium sp.]
MRTSFATTTKGPCSVVTDPSAAAPSGFHLLALPSIEAVAQAAAQALLEASHQAPRRPLGLATGKTMAPIYASLVTLVLSQPQEAQEALRQRWCSFNLDEYVGLGPQDPGSFAAEMLHSLAHPLGIHPAQVHLPDGLAPDPAAEAHRYGLALHGTGGVGLQLLGLGLNGHVGFNEPPCEPDSTTRCLRLSASTRQANAGAFGGRPDQVPPRAITLGLADILRAERILLVVTGAQKAPILRRLLEEPPSADLPASWLHLHRSVYLMADPSALGN